MSNTSIPAIALLCCVAAQTAQAGSYNTVYSFQGGADSAVPAAPLVAYQGLFYGTATGGGGSGCGGFGCGTVFTVTSTGVEKVLHSFGSGTDGQYPTSGLLRIGARFYGTTFYGGTGTNANGTVFSITPAGTEKVISSFLDGEGRLYDPDGNLTVASGVLYGTTLNGGTNANTVGGIFSVSLEGAEHDLYSFADGNDGANAYGGMVAISGTLYGTTSRGGSGGVGTLFSYSASGGESVIHAFIGSGVDGNTPLAGLTLLNGVLFGVTEAGGTASKGGGTVFTYTPGGGYTVLYSFGTHSNDGLYPEASLLAYHGALYGTTEAGGTYGGGTVFKLTTTGKMTVLHDFGNGTDGNCPVAALIASGGLLYGTAAQGGTAGNGTVFAISP